jgi:hypothetical protein
MTRQPARNEAPPAAAGLRQLTRQAHGLHGFFRLDHIGMTMHDLEASWRTFEQRPFPRDCANAEIEGVELTDLDTFTAGCVSAFIANGGRLDAERVRVLTRCCECFEKVVPQLTGEAREYFGQLRDLSRLVLIAASAPA